MQRLGKVMINYLEMSARYIKQFHNVIHFIPIVAMRMSDRQYVNISFYFH